MSLQYQGATASSAAPQIIYLHGRNDSRKTLTASDVRTLADRFLPPGKVGYAYPRVPEEVLRAVSERQSCLAGSLGLQAKAVRPRHAPQLLPQGVAKASGTDAALGPNQEHNYLYGRQPRWHLLYCR